MGDGGLTFVAIYSLYLVNMHEAIRVFMGVEHRTQLCICQNLTVLRIQICIILLDPDLIYTFLCRKNYIFVFYNSLYFGGTVLQIFVLRNKPVYTQKAQDRDQDDPDPQHWLSMFLAFTLSLNVSIVLCSTPNLTGTSSNISQRG